MAKTLPNKPSKLIRLAVEDLTKVERNKKYRINMGEWHKPSTVDGEYLDTGDTATSQVKVCQVCFAGAVISQTLKTPINVCQTPYGDEFSNDLREKLEALDSFRVGDISGGLNSFYDIEDANFPRIKRKVVSYSKRNSAKFKKQMRELANDLERIGM